MDSKIESKHKIDYKTCLSHLGYILRKSKCSEQELEKIKKELTVQPLFIPGYGSEEPEKYKIFFQYITASMTCIIRFYVHLFCQKRAV